MPRIYVTIDQELYDYYKEHAVEKDRSMANLALYALKRHCSMNPLTRERAAKKKK